ncbi:hypothetical protein CONCODRAFT_8516 [Conidiobolus coronatus NRRL 28638]|uniref:RNI-like protein n=1 Tax=Conidiobolus coronatus (strain ATCC 28846 / CBS 209.66 / NRRL 28638) TaxID=796925 RepID=A0A137P257_CONC2|nr:hypothetical protein CONCODRAFT_8516 [Conidiobolus coronatus NRRL 28638]|eukprot:KXN69127.1 hypothetical protein CONCODRAFT_8516 [Conidiobolus coronatus NRRL 28638]
MTKIENEKNNEVDWLNIVFNIAFQSYLDFGTLKEISLLSKFVRAKLNPKLFYNISLKANRKHVNGKIEKFYNVSALSALTRHISSNSDKLQKSISIEKALNNINYEVQNIIIFVSSLYLKSLDRIGYYLFSIFKSFDSLSLLNITGTTIPYTLLINLGLLIPNLKSFELISTTLVKLPTDRLISNSIIFPPSLSYLNISRVEVTELGLLSDPFEYLFSEGHAKNSYSFTPPKILLPSLKKLIFAEYNETKSGLEEFLHINPCLESLKTETIYLDKVYNINSLKSLETDMVECLNGDIKFTSQESIEELTTFVNIDTYENVAKLCLLCPNLEKLRFSIDCHKFSQHSFDRFLISVMSNLPKLKTFHLEIYTDDHDVLNINKFSYIENIIIETKCINLSNIKFEKSKNLKNIEFKSLSFRNNELKQEFVKLCNKFKNWEFKSRNHSIKGYKIN